MSTREAGDLVWVGDVDATARAPDCAHVIETGVPEIALGLWTLDGVRTVNRWMHHRTKLVAVEATVTDHLTHRSSELSLLLKHDPQHGGWHADRTSRLFGVALPGNGPGRMMRTLGVSADGTLVAENVPGRAWEEYLCSPASTRLAGAVARFLVAIQASGAALDPGVDPLPETEREVGELRTLACALPSLGGSVAELEAALLPALSAGTRGSLLPAHGDFHPKNVIVSRAGSRAGSQATVVAVDLDDAGLQEPALDIGYAVAHVVASMSHLGCSRGRSAAAAARLWDEYRRAGGAAPDERIAVQAARAFVQLLHFELIGFGGGSLGSLEAWSSMALRLLRLGRRALEPWAT